MHRITLTLFLLFCLAAGARSVLGSVSSEVAPGPGAVIAMHKQLFRAIDTGDMGKASSFLSPDLHMDRDYAKRPCMLFLVDEQDRPLRAEGFDESRKLIESWVAGAAAKGGSWSTEVIQAWDDCFSGELSWCTLEFERSFAKDGRTTTRRYRSTSLVTYDEGWKITHWHISPAEPGPLKASGR